MVVYALRRLVQTLPVLFLSSILVFGLVRFIPGDPAMLIAGPDALPEQIVAARARLGLDKPIYVQYAIWLAQVVRGDLGVSILNGYPVFDLIARKFLATLQLTAGGLLVALCISLPLGILASVRRGGWFERLTSLVVALGQAIPTFWLGILLVLVFSLQLKWLPPSGQVAFSEKPGLALRLMILPSVTLGFYSATVLTRFLKSSMLEVMEMDYVRTARAKGLADTGILTRHVLKNALIPVVTILGLQLGAFLGGAVVTESIFDWPGLGRLMLQAIGTRDYPVLQGTVLFVVVTFVCVTLITDLTYGYLDPRIRYQ
ncbi:MAG: ABC transporter permease [Caldilineaceae bacterium]|nr:ABC transporter permease [Caldilineaceae bacterium]